jgi:CBS domain-containing protein
MANKLIARDLMTESPRTVEPDDDLAVAIRIMQEEDCGIVPVTEGNGDLRVVGVITDRDIALHLGSRDAKPSSVPVQDAMTTRVVSVGPDAEAQEISRRMQEAQVRRILVTDGGRLLGVISTADLARSAKKRGQKALGNEVERVIVGVSEERGR